MRALVCVCVSVFGVTLQSLSSRYRIFAEQNMVTCSYALSQCSLYYGSPKVNRVMYVHLSTTMYSNTQNSAIGTARQISEIIPGH